MATEDEGREFRLDLPSEEDWRAILRAIEERDRLFRWARATFGPENAWTTARRLFYWARWAGLTPGQLDRVLFELCEVDGSGLLRLKPGLFTV